MPSEVYTKPPKPGTVLNKTEAGYRAEGPFSCNTCLWYKSPSGGDVGSCLPVGFVNKAACCDYWNNRDAPEQVGKEQAEYVYVPGSDYTCSQCKFYDSLRHSCWPVDGYISPSGSCNKWTP